MTKNTFILHFVSHIDKWNMVEETEIPGILQ